MKTEFRVNPHFCRVAPKFGMILKAVVAVLALLTGYMVTQATGSIVAVLKAASNETHMAHTAGASAGQGIASDEQGDILSYNRSVALLNGFVREPIAHPIDLLNTIEKHLPADSRLESFDYVRSRREVVMRVSSRKHASIQALIVGLEGEDGLKEVLVQAERQKDEQVLHTLVVRI